MKRPLFFCLIILATTSWADDVGNLLETLRTGDAAERKIAAAALIKVGAPSVKALHSVYFADFNALLRDLGADSFRARTRATKALIAIGSRCQAQVTAMRNATSDPEVRFRCDKVLKATKADADQGVTEAVRIVLTIGAELPENLPFVEHFFASFGELPPDVKNLVPQAVRMCKNDALLPPLLPKLDKDVQTKAVLEAIKARMPAKATKIIAEFKELQFKRSLDIEPIVKEMNSWNGYGNDDFEKIAKRLESQPLYEKKRSILIQKFLDSPHLKAKTLGILLAKDDIGPYVPTIVSQMKEFKSSPYPIFYFFDDVKDMHNHFLPHADVFLDSNLKDVKAQGVEICHGDPKTYKNRILQVFTSADEYSLAQDSCKFLLKHFPEMRDDLQKMTVKRILDIGPKNDDSVNALAFVLKDQFKYKGNEFDDWWSEWSKAEGVHASYALDAALRLNVSGDVIYPMAIASDDLNADMARHILKTATMDKAIIINGLKALVGKRVPHYGSLDKVLLEEVPECFTTIIPVIMKRVGQEKRFEQSFQSILDRYAKAIAETPELATLVRPYLADESHFMRFYAAGILLRAFANDEASEHVLFALPKDGEKYYQEALLKDMFAYDAPFERMRPLLNAHLEKAEDKHWSMSIIIDHLTPRYKPHLSYFRQQFHKQVEKGHATNARRLAEAMLWIDPDDDAAIAHLRGIVTNDSDMEAAVLTLKFLAQLDRDPELTVARLDRLYSSCKSMGNLNEALSNSKKNLKAALPVVKTHLDRILATDYNQLEDLTWENEDYQKALTADLVKALETGRTKTSESALSVLTSGSCVLKDHMDSLKRVYAKTSDPAHLRSLLWMLANMETDAAPFATILPKRFEESTGSDRSHYLFAMASISPDGEDRRAYTKALIDHVAALTDKYKPYRMIRLIEEFPEITYPFLTTLMDKRKENNRHELVWALIKEKPFSESSIKTFDTLLRRCQKGAPGYDDVAENLCWALQDRLEDAERFLPLLKKAKPRLRRNLGYRLLMYGLRERRKTGT